MRGTPQVSLSHPFTGDGSGPLESGWRIPTTTGLLTLQDIRLLLAEPRELIMQLFKVSPERPEQGLRHSSVRF